jgi:hypothetical protein
MALRGTRQEHAERAASLLEKAWHHAEDALRKFEEGKVAAAWHDYSVALIAWGSYMAESKWSGRIRDEERVQKLLERGDRRLQGYLGV